MFGKLSKPNLLSRNSKPTKIAEIHVNEVFLSQSSLLYIISNKFPRCVPFIESDQNINVK
jgi:hypothetical protein